VDVNINNLRKQAIYTYNRLCKTLNDNRDSDDSIRIDCEDISQDMNDLRMCLVTLACTYNEGDENFKEVIDEVGEILSLEFEGGETATE